MDAATFETVLLSIEIAAVATALAAVLGLGIAWALARWSFPGKWLLESAIFLPIVLPPTVVGYGLLWLVGRNGLLGKMAGHSLAFSPAGAVLASMVVALPLMVLASRGGLEGVDPALEAAARTLGAAPTRVAFTVTLPLAWRGVLAGVVLAGARALGEFGATLMVAGNIPGLTRTVPLAIYTAVESGQEDQAVALVALHLAMALLFLGALSALGFRLGGGSRAAR